MADKTVSITLNGIDSSDKKSSSKIAYVNPNLDNVTLRQFAGMCADLSTDTNTSVIKTTDEDITNPGTELEDLCWSFYGRQDAQGGEVDKQVSLWQPTQQTSESFAFFFVNKNGFGSGLTLPAVTISGYKPKGYTFNFMQSSSMIFVTSETHSFSQSNLQLWQMKIEIAETATARGATLYSYFRANEADVEAIS